MLTNALVGTLTDGSGLVINVYATELGGGGYTLTVQVAEGFADLRGFFIDGASAVSFTMEGKAAALDTILAKDVNMNGTGYTFDSAYEIGTAGIGKDDIQEAVFTFLGDLADIDTLDFGIRATSTGELRDGSVKLVSQFDIPEPPPVAVDNFPTFDKDISHITLYYAQDEGDVRGDFTETVNMGGKTVYVEAKDGYYTVKIDGWEDQAAGGSDDLDDYLGDITAWLVANDANIDADSELVGVAIKGGNVENGGYDNYYAMDGDPDVDTAPIDLADNKEIDQSYEYTDVFGTATV